MLTASARTGGTAGYVLAGGRSSRMGTNKALLPWRRGTLLGYIAGEVEAAAGSVTLVGSAETAFRTLPDEYPGFGPVGAIATALRDTTAEWNLIVACDMPGVTREWLALLLAEAGGDATVPVTPDGRPHPLCAVWNRSALDVVSSAVDRGVHTVNEVVRRLDCRTLAVEDHVVANVNTPEEWACFAGRRE